MTALMAPGEATATPERFPFTVIDQAVHLLDTPAEPWGIQLELGVGGHLDEDRLRSAVAMACAGHPMAGPDAARRFADRFVADLLALAGPEAHGA